MSGQRDRLGAAGGAAAPGDQLATRGSAAAAHHAPARAPRAARFSGAWVSAAAAQAAQDGSGTPEPLTPDIPAARRQRAAGRGCGGYLVGARGGAMDEGRIIPPLERQYGALGSHRATQRAAGVTQRTLSFGAIETVVGRPLPRTRRRCGSARSSPFSTRSGMPRSRKRTCWPTPARCGGRPTRAYRGASGHRSPRGSGQQGAPVVWGARPGRG